MTTETAEDIIQILAVDDEENILSSLKRLLRKHEFNVLTATSGERALNILRENPDIALIISDQRMPEMSGVDFLERAKKIAPDATRMILTGYTDVHAAIEGINRGEAYRYISKPWDDNELVSIVNEATLKFALLKDNQRLTRIVKKQNEELKQWNSDLEARVQEQTEQIQKQNSELKALNERLTNNFRNSIAVFSSLLELRHEKTVNHSKNVAAISVKIAKALEMSAAEIATISAAALLHDIGMIGIPDEILTKGRDTLLLEKNKEFMQHPIRGQAAIDSIEDLRDAGILIRHHHENYDGSGFPDGLTSDKIPIASRIISLADFIDITMNELFAENTFEAILHKVKQEFGRKFDRKLFRYIEAPAKELYTLLSDNSTEEKEMELCDLTQGMVLSKNARSGTGLILLSKGTQLDEKNIQTLKRYFKLDPPDTGVFIWKKK